MLGMHGSVLACLLTALLLVAIVLLVVHVQTTRVQRAHQARYARIGEGFMNARGGLDPE